MTRACGLAVIAVFTPFTVPPLVAQQPGWFSAWASAHNVGREVPGLSGGAVRLIVHPNAAGYRAMGEFFDLALFSPGPK